MLGAEVAEAVGRPGGSSESLASLLPLTDRRRVFVKAANAEQAPAVSDFHRREIAITRQLFTPWAADHLDTPADLEARAPQAPAGDTPQHGDLYPFTIVLNDDSVFVADWPHAWIDAPRCDSVTLPSGASLSGLDPQEFAERHPLTRAADERQIDVMLAAHSGFLLRIVTSVDPGADRNVVDMMTALAPASVRRPRSRTGRRRA